MLLLKGLNKGSIGNFSGSNSRSTNLNKQIILSFFIKAISLPLNFILLSVLYSYLDKERYGIWFTIISIANMLVFMDIGIGNGLRNQLAESIALDKKDTARELVSTAYIAISSIAFFLLFILTITSPFISWKTLFNTANISAKELQYTVFFVIAALILNFIGSLINYILLALQKNALSGFLIITSNLLFIISIFIVKDTYANNLQLLAILYIFSIVIAGLILNVIVFRYFSFLKPSFHFFKREKLKELTSLGFKFFILQLSPVILTATDNIIITQYLGPQEVTNYSITQRLFTGIWSTAWLFLAPLWSSITEAYVKKDYTWIRNRLNKTYMLVIPITTFVLVIVIVFFKEITYLWLGEVVNVDLRLQLLMAFVVILNIWNNIFLGFLNGISRLKETLIVTTLGNIMNIPLSILFITYFKLGVIGVILATVISMLPFAVTGSYVSYRILYKKLIIKAQ